MHRDKVRHENSKNDMAQTSLFSFGFFQKPSDGVILVVVGAFHQMLTTLRERGTYRFIWPIDTVLGFHLHPIFDNRPEVFLGLLDVPRKRRHQSPDETRQF
jgi:hypothetical protein